jgi:hypothetical protein
VIASIGLSVDRRVVESIDTSMSDATELKKLVKQLQNATSDQVNLSSVVCSVYFFF